MKIALINAAGALIYLEASLIESIVPFDGGSKPQSSVVMASGRTHTIDATPDELANTIEAARWDVTAFRNRYEAAR